MRIRFSHILVSFILCRFNLVLVNNNSKHVLQPITKILVPSFLVAENKTFRHSFYYESEQFLL